ncbi:MAG: tRNA epoxyqueuosine(34) reductase QueG [Blastochloris sp.]|nr:tRNA epoxyqueuosine(34) reductase QueG [Blastochloris sp.]
MKSPVTEIKQEATRLGFDVCRVASVATSPHYAEFLDWLKSGAHGEMLWLAKNPERRRDPRELMPDCRSLILTGTNYFQQDLPQRGRVATYALGRDYHDRIGSALKQLSLWIEQQYGGHQRPFVDSSAVMEKPWAMRAGLGWQGKNTMLIHRRLGNWLSLGGLLTSLDLEPDPPETDHCGSCSRCLQACPTQAITAPYQLDARRCLAYLSIEHPGPIPLEYRRPMGDRLFGCEDCLSVCPWNRWAQATRDAHFQALPRPDLREMLAWDDSQFRQHYRGTPIFRLKHSRWLRNICVVLGNVGGPDDLPALNQAGDSSDPLIREHALWAISEIRQRQM